MIFLAGLVTAAGSMLSACGGAAEGNATGPSPAAGGAAAGGAAGTNQAVAAIPAENCRWEGYGIGSAGLSQCDAQHVLLHAETQCTGVGGRIDGVRGVPAECPAEALEERVYCCYADHLPSAADTPIARSSGTMTGRLAPTMGEDGSRAALLARAAASCVVGDWNALYAADGTSVEMLRFGCKAP